MKFIRKTINDIIELLKKIILNIDILNLLLKKQFFCKNKFIFVLLPLLISFLIIHYGLFINILDKEQISLIVTSISLFGGLLLNFLILILSDKGSILYTEGIKEIYGIIKTGKYDDRGKDVEIKVNYFEFLYYKIFFIIILSIFYLAFFVLYQFGFFYPIITLLKDSNISIPYIDFIINIKSLIYFIYIYFMIFYFVNVLYLILKLYYLLQRKEYKQ